MYLKRMTRGFSLIELVSVMLIVGILSVYAVAKLEPDSTSHFQYCREVATALKRVQNINMNQGIDINVFFKSFNENGSGIMGLCYKDECSNNEKLFDKAILDGTTITEQVFRFNEYGKPVATNDNLLDKVTLTIGSINTCQVDISDEGVISWQ